MPHDPKPVEALVGGLGDGDCGPLEARFVQALHQGMGLEYEDAERWADIFMRSLGCWIIYRELHGDPQEVDDG